jgi:flavin reductase (DIM6/NTAB) family NADH-FMN oxidoreductase RutF/rubredoxin
MNKTDTVRPPQEALFKVGYGLYLLSAKENGRDNACIINTLLQVTSASPVVCVITVNKQNLTCEMIRNTKVFNLSVLTEKAPFELYKCFGYQTGRTADKFGEYGGSISRSKNGLIYLTDNANAFLSFNVTGTVDFGSHTMFTAEMTESEVLTDDESVTYCYYQRCVKPKPQKAKTSGYRCRICSYFYEGETLPPDYVCPICKHGAEDFVKE